MPSDEFFASDYRNFHRAQRQYDAQLPPNYYTSTRDCPKCNGDGTDEEGEVCRTCEGAGEVEVDTRGKKIRDE